MSDDAHDPHGDLASGLAARWDAQDRQGEAAVRRSCEDKEASDARWGHVRLDETRAVMKKGPLYVRISWLIELLTREKTEELSLRLAAECERDEARARLAASEHRRCAAENRARQFELLLEAQSSSSPRPLRGQ